MSSKVERGLAARRAGRGWAEIADVMSVSVPEAKVLLAEPLAERRAKAAVVGGVHVPPDPKCVECECLKSKHTRTVVYAGVTYDDACSVCVEDNFTETYRRKCEGFTVPISDEDMRRHHVKIALSGGMSRSTLGAMYRLGINLRPNRYSSWGGRADPPVQTARIKTQFKRAQRKLRRHEARSK